MRKPAKLLRVRIALLCLSILPPLTLAHADPAPKKLPLTLAADTTIITSPLNPDGTPNYLEALNKELSKDVTSENNAAVPNDHAKTKTDDIIIRMDPTPFASPNPQG